MKKRLGAMVCVLVLLSMLTVFTVACNKDGFKINFYDGDSIVTSISTNGKEAITLPTDPVKAGYTFEGWFFEKEFTNQLLSNTYEKTKLKEEVNVYAKWTAFTYTINCDNEGAITTVQATYDKAFTCPMPTKTDYVFQGWYNGETQITDNLGASLVTFKDENGKVFNLTAKWALQTEGMEFSVDGKTLTKYTGTAQYVVIPDTVTSIGYEAFYNCSGLKSVTIPSSVTSIAEYTFNNCKELISVTIQNGVTNIAQRVFYNCNGLTSIAIPASVTSIKLGAFSYCSGLTSITVDAGNTKYHSAGNCLIETATGALIAGCKNSTIPDSVTSIADYAFCACTGLTSITIPSSVTSIGTNAFFYCIGLTSITIPSSVTSIAVYAIECCDELTSITVEAGNTKYHSAGNCIIETATSALIAGCKNSTIPDSVTSIGVGAFSNCRGLTSITIPSSVTSIASMAFFACNGLTSITIPATVTTIGTNAFYNCANLATINCVATAQPSGWNANWIGVNCPATVVWGYVAA